MKYYIIYKLTNKINNKIYIGKHATLDINDGYMGGGKYIKRALNKYGIANFKKEILYIFNNQNEMNKTEADIVDANFLKRKDVYNITLGGKGSTYHIINSPFAQLYRSRGGYIAGKLASQNKTGMFSTESHQKALITQQRNKIGIFNPEIRKNAFKNKHHTPLVRNNQSQGILSYIKKNGHPHTGSKWISNVILEKTIKVKGRCIKEYLKKGWVYGRLFGNRGCYGHKK